MTTRNGDCIVIAQKQSQLKRSYKTTIAANVTLKGLHKQNTIYKLAKQKRHARAIS